MRRWLLRRQNRAGGKVGPLVRRNSFDQISKSLRSLCCARLTQDGPTMNIDERELDPTQSR